MTSPFFDTPWNPGIIATPPSDKNLFILEIFIFIILAFKFSPSVKIGICQLSHDLELTPISINAPDSKELVTCSPDAKSTSSSLLLKSLEIVFDWFNNSFVLPDIAETIAMTS